MQIGLFSWNKNRMWANRVDLKCVCYLKLAPQYEVVTFVKYAAIFHLDSDFGDPASAQTLISWQIKMTE